MEQILNFADSSFKYILLAFNVMTLVVIYIHKNKQKLKKQHHVLFVTAHPDDEVMFFRPSITSISKDYFVHLLCLSGGSTERQQQLKKSAQRLKLHKVQCLKNQKLQDSMISIWPPEQIQKNILNYVDTHNIKAIFTFDCEGVSGHLNHKAIYKALANLHYPSQKLKVLNKKASQLSDEEKQQIEIIKASSIKIYHLKTVNIVRKYTAFFEIIIALLRDFSWVNLNVLEAYQSMKIHKSQFLWFRKLWVIFSQYQYLNVFEMKRLKIRNQNHDDSNVNHNILQENQKQQINQLQTKKQK